MTDFRLGNTYSDVDIADYAKRLQDAEGVVANACGHGYQVLDGGPETSLRSPEETRDSILTYPGATLSVRTGPENGVAGLLVHTYGPDTGMHTLIEHGVFCPGCDVATEAQLRCNGEITKYHVVLFRTGNCVFPRWTFNQFPGVVLVESGESVSIAPGHNPSCSPNCASVDFHYLFGRDYLSHGIAELPAQLEDVLILEQSQAQQIAQGERVSKGVKRELFDPIPAGRRNTELTRRAGYLIGVKKMPEHAAFEALLQINAECCQPPLDPKEVAGITRSIARRHERNG